MSNMCGIEPLLFHGGAQPARWHNPVGVDLNLHPFYPGLRVTRNPGLEDAIPLGLGIGGWGGVWGLSVRAGSPTVGPRTTTRTSTSTIGGHPMRSSESRLHLIPARQGRVRNGFRNGAHGVTRPTFGHGGGVKFPDG